MRSKKTTELLNSSKSKKQADGSINTDDGSQWIKQFEIHEIETLKNNEDDNNKKDSSNIQESLTRP